MCSSDLDENYTVTLANPIGTTLGTASAIGAILDDDVAGRADRVMEGQPYLINISRVVKEESYSWFPYGRRYYFPALSWSVTPRSAGLDDFSDPISGGYPEIDLGQFWSPFTSPGGMVYENVVINVGTRDDAQRESTESFRVDTSERFYHWEYVPPTQPWEFGHYVRIESFSSSQYYGYIFDNDLPELSIAPASAIIHEGSNGTPAASFFTVSRTGDLSLPTQVQWTVAGTGGNSVSPDDFGAATLPSGTLDFPAGLASQTVQLLLSSDALNEQDEMFQINLSEPIGGRVSVTAGSASVTVKNVDWIPPEIIAMSVEGSSVKLQFSEPINSTGLLPARFKASLVSTTTSTRSIASVSCVSGDPTSLVLTVSGAQPAGSQGVRIAYTDLSAANNLTGVVQDVAGNDMPTIAGLGRAAETFASFSNVPSLNSSYSSLILKGLAVMGAGNIADNNLTVVQDTPVSNVFDGAAGIDSMDAGDGADIYLVSVGDHHGGAEIHDSGASGSDELRFASNVQDDCLVIYSGDTGLERVVVGTGTGASAVSTGLTSLDVDASSAPNPLVITGNYGANLLVGSAFADTINGNRGNDILLGGDGQDVFVFNSPLNSLTNKDCLPDFRPLEDKIQLDNSVFTGLLLDGLLSPAALGFGLKATTVDHRIIYHNSSGRLLYDSNGSLPGGSSVFAVLPAGLQSSINAGIFEVI